jgi:hypothetical protein
VQRTWIACPGQTVAPSLASRGPQPRAGPLHAATERVLSGAGRALQHSARAATTVARPEASRRWPSGEKEHTVGFPGPQSGCLDRSKGPARGEAKRRRERWSPPVL